MLVIIDNYDSFTYNVVQAFGSMGADVRVFRNDQVTLDALDSMQPQGIIISPGSVHPEAAGISCEAIRSFAGRVPILGIGLGHQCIAHVYGATIVTAENVMHGRTTDVHHEHSSLYNSVPSPFVATCYHSRLVSDDMLPVDLQVTARTEDGTVMGIRHRTHAVEGVQFHPESILTEWGSKILANFAARTGVSVKTGSVDVARPTVRPATR